MGKIIWMFLAVMLATLNLAADFPEPEVEKRRSADRWVDSVFNKLSEEERLGQLFMVAAYSNKDKSHVQELERLIQEFHIGGLIFLKGSPIAQTKLANHYQQLSKVPLLVATTAEYGLGMQLDSAISFPRQLTLGAITDDKIIYQMGKRLAKQLVRMGIHMNFAPVVDVNVRDGNLKTGDRSFGEDKNRVAAKSLSYMKGLKDGGIIANAKLFPSLEDNGSPDFTLPIVSHSQSRLRETEMYPLRQLIRDSMMSMTMSHASIAQIDKTPNRSSAFSTEVIKNTFRKEFGFQGLIFTDALNVKEVNKAFKAGEVDLQALLAGNDVLIFSEDISKAIKKIRSAIKSKTLNQSEVDRTIKKVLMAKYWVGLNKYKAVDIENLSKEINDPKDEWLNYELYAKSLTIIENKNNLIPFFALDTLSFASVSIGLPPKNDFQPMLEKYAEFSSYSIPNKYAPDTVYNNILRKVASHKVVVVGLHGMSNSEGNNYGISPNTITFLERLKEKTQVVVCAFGNPSGFKFLSSLSHLVCAYEDNKYTRQLVPQMLFGAIESEGTLPLTVSEKYIVGRGIKTRSLKRLRHGLPESVGVDSYVLSNIDKVAEFAIKNGTTPGCQVLVAKSGTVIWNKSYGFMAYDSLHPVTNETLYDIASVTKVVATVQVLMFLEERGLIDLDQTLSYYLPELKGTNKSNLIIREVLTHQAGLTPFIPHWIKTVSYGTFDKRYYSSEKSEQYPLEVARGLYGIKSLPDSVWKWSVKSELLRKKKKQVKFEYKYSDVGYLFLRRIAEKILNQPMEDFLDQNFYSPLGADKLLYRPLRRIPIDQIAPTEDDKDFRRQLLRGTVHDQGAAMAGGVAAHAGLFSNANDLAKLLQMNLQKGFYGGQRFLFDGTVSKFTQRQYGNNRRGLGWDKPAFEYDGQTSGYASDKLYGHTGFSGTCVWVDPDKEVVYIFLSNRIYPNANNNALLKEGIRTRVQEEIYKAINSYNLLQHLQ